MSVSIFKATSSPADRTVANPQSIGTIPRTIIMTVTVSRLYDDYATASRVVGELESAGIPHSDISIVASNADDWYAAHSATRGAAATTGLTPTRVDRDRDGIEDRAGAGAGAGIGAVLGGGAGLLTGLGVMAIPGLGPVVAAGWLVATAVGALAGGATGGVIGALTKSGVSNEDAQVYAEGVRRGGTLVSARVPPTDQSRAEAILDRSAVNIANRRAAYVKSGWNRFDEGSPPYTSDQVRRERELYTRRTPGF
jgi:hypothetical protein